MEVLFASFTWLETGLLAGSFGRCCGIVKVCPGRATFAMSTGASVGAGLALGEGQLRRARATVRFLNSGDLRV